MFQYYNANPLGRKVNDCTIRAISLATGRSWDETFEELSKFAQKQAIMPDDTMYIDEYLDKNFKKICGCRGNIKISVEEFTKLYPKGVYLITMNGHITCCIDGCIYDTFDPKNRIIWDIYYVR